MDKTWQRQVEGFVADGQAGHARGGEGHSMIRKGARENLVFPRLAARVVIGADDFQCALVGLRSGIRKDRAVQAGRGFFCEELGDAHWRLCRRVEK